jgi:hypothetical protein
MSYEKAIDDLSYDVCSSDLLLINLIHIGDLGQIFFFSEVEMDLQFSLVTNLGAVCLSYKRLSTPSQILWGGL